MHVGLYGYTAKTLTACMLQMPQSFLEKGKDKKLEQLR